MGGSSTGDLHNRGIQYEVMVSHDLDDLYMRYPLVDCHSYGKSPGFIAKSLIYTSINHHTIAIKPPDLLLEPSIDRGLMISLGVSKKTCGSPSS